jgi:hypothetical protein
MLFRFLVATVVLDGSSVVTNTPRFLLYAVLR